MTQATTAFNIFNARFDQYADKDCGMPTVVRMLTDPRTLAMKPGDIVRGTTTGGYRTIVLMSKMGPIVVMVMYGTAVQYMCTDDLAHAASWKRAGLGKEGILDTVDQINYVFAIPDSYL